MSFDSKIRYLRIALVIIGLIFVIGLYPAMVFFPDGWLWKPHQPEYEQMMLGIYGTLGIFLLIASRNPLEHLSLIWFTVWSSFVHGGIMLIQAIVNYQDEYHNLFGDVPGLLFIAIILAILTPRKKELRP